MKNLGTILAAGFLLVVLLLYMCTFQVRFTEVAIKKTWGQPDENAITEPGLKFKWPRPIQSVVVYDKRIRLMGDRTEETRTIDGKNLLLKTFTLWRISDPSRFHTNFPGGVEEGEKKLRTTVITHKHATTGQHEFSDFVSTDPTKRKLREIEDKIRVAVAENALSQFGIEIVDFGIERLGLPQAVTSAIFESMKSHEEAKAERYVAEGKARASDIMASAAATRDRMRAEVRRKVEEIRTEADRIVSNYYEEFKEYPQLRIYLDKLATIVRALEGRTTLIFDTAESPFDVFDLQARENVPVLDGVTTAKTDTP